MVYKASLKTNYNQKEYPVNPIHYIRNRKIKQIFRYIQTHPDMDHMDGIKALFAAFSPTYFWDTNNKKEMSGSSWAGSPYSSADWRFYKKLRDGNPQSNPKRLTPLSGASVAYNDGHDDSRDSLYVLAPTKGLVDSANKDDTDYNDCSYVILYECGRNRIVFGGDSHDKTWEHILAVHRSRITNVDLLIAPHHGRKSGRSYKFLDVMRPKMTFFGNARAEHLAYSAWSARNLKYITNNQANCMVVDSRSRPMRLYVTHRAFAKDRNPGTHYDPQTGAWFLETI